MYKVLQKKDVKDNEWTKLNNIAHKFSTYLPFSSEHSTCIVISCDKLGVPNWNFMLGIASSPSCKIVKLCWVTTGKLTNQCNKMLIDAVRTACPKAQLLVIHSHVHTIPLMHQLGFLVCKRSLPLVEPINVTTNINKVNVPVHSSACRAGMDVSYMIMLQSILDAGLAPHSYKSISSLIEQGVPMYKQI